MNDKHANHVACRVWFALILTLASAAGGTRAQDPPGKAAVPNEAEQERASRLVREVYGQAYDEAKAPAEKLALAKKLLKDGTETKDDLASRFVLLGRARDLATEIGDGETAFQAVDEMAGTFAIDALKMKAGILEEVANTARLPIQQRMIAQEALWLMGQAVAEDNFTIAGQLGQFASARATKGRDRELILLAQNRTKEIEEIAAAYANLETARATLEEKPADPDANLAVGKYLCFLKGEWKQGAPMLALGEDAALKALAVKELEGAPSHAQQMELGDGWWDLAANQQGTARRHVLRRAGDWYQRALPGLSGLAKVKLDKRLAEIFRATASEITYLAELEPLGARVCGAEPGALSVRGVKVSRGLWAHPFPRRASSHIIFALHQAFGELKGAAGINDTAARARAPLTFRIVGDGTLLWQSGRLQNRGDVQTFRVKISGVEKLELFVDCAGSNAYAHAVWIDPIMSK